MCLKTFNNNYVFVYKYTEMLELMSDHKKYTWKLSSKYVWFPTIPPTAHFVISLSWGSGGKVVPGTN